MRYGGTSRQYLDQAWVSRALGQGHVWEMLILQPGHQFNLDLGWRSSTVKVIKGQGHPRSNFKCYWQAGGGFLKDILVVNVDV